MVTAFVPASQVQPDLLDRQDRPRSKRMMTALDVINARWGGAWTRGYASNGLTKPWQP